MRLTFIMYNIFIKKTVILIALFFSNYAISSSYIETANIDKNLIIMGTSDGYLVLFDIIKDESIAKFKAHNRTITDISFSHDGQKIASTGADGINIWDRTTLKLLSSLPYQANNACFSPKDNSLLISGFGLIAVVDPTSGAKILNIPHKSTAKASFDHQGDLILITDFDQSLVLVYEIKSGAIIYSISEYWPYHSLFSSDNESIIISSMNGVTIHNINQPKFRKLPHTKSFAHDLNNWILRSSANTKGSQITSIDNAGCLLRFDLQTNDYKPVESRDSMKFSAFYDNDSKIVLVSDKQVSIYDATSMQLIHRKKIF